MLDLKEGTTLKEPVYELHFKEDKLHDPLVNEYHLRALGYATKEELDCIRKESFKVNEIMKEFFSGVGIDLIDFKLECGRHKGQILLGDEVSPDTCRFWEKGT